MELEKNVIEEKIETDMEYYIHLTVYDVSSSYDGCIYNKIIAATNDGLKANEMYQAIDEQMVLKKVLDIREEYQENNLAIGYTIDKNDYGFTKKYFVDIYNKWTANEKANADNYTVRICLASIPKDRLLI